jgi:tetratricopeptide (TPR) repeat protein
LATRAVEIDKDLPVAYFVTGLVYREKGEYVKALVEAEKAIAIDPNYANAHVLLATLLYYAGRPEEGLERIKKAMRLNPHHPYNYPFHLGQAYFILGRYQEAIMALEQGLETNPSSERMRVWLAAAYARSGREEDAKWEAEQVLAQNPDFSLQRIRKAFPFKDPADMERFLDGLRRAGITQ